MGMGHVNKEKKTAFGHDNRAPMQDRTKRFAAIGLTE